MGKAGGRPRSRRHHRVRGGAARRCRLCRAAEGRRHGDGEEAVRRRRVGQGGLRPVRARVGRDRRGQHWAAAGTRDGERGSVRPRLDARHRPLAQSRVGPAPHGRAVRGVPGAGGQLMASRYIANTPAEQDQMLRVIGAASVEELLVKIPPKARLSRPLALPPALAETDLIRHLKTLADANADADRYACFLGAGSYDHYVPSPINHLVLRGEFFTAYTPYQPEASQGTLRTIYEYQTMIAELAGMDVANASIYAGAVLIVVADPVNLGVLEAPGKLGADLVVGEGQGLGVPMSFGGPNLGVFAAKRELVRRMPGRLVGATVDRDGRRGFVLTLQTREQHIRRAKATSNICTNVALCALMATIYLATLGRHGLVKVGELSAAKAHYAARRLTALSGVSLRFQAPFFKEFTLKLPKPPDRVVARLAKERILAGVPLKAFDRALADCLLVAVTEKRTKEEIDAFAQALERAVV